MLSWLSTNLNPWWKCPLGTVRGLWHETRAGLVARQTVPEADAPEVDLLTWGQQMLPAHFTQPPSAMHRWLAEQLDALHAQRGGRLNVVGPRGSAKSTVATLAYVLRMAVERREPYIWIISDTRRQAELHLANVKHELESNALLAARYPRGVQRGKRWQSSGIALAGGVTIEAYGTGQSIRGKRRHAERPTLIVCDDLQNDEHIRSGTQRLATHEWFHGAVLHAGTKGTNVVNLATALHRDALAMRLGQTPGWVSRTFRAIQRWPQRMDLWQTWEQLWTDADNPHAARDAQAFYDEHRALLHTGADVLWPQVEDLLTLMKLRLECGATAFEREKQGQPLDPAGCEWPEEYFDESIWFDEWPDDLVLRTIALDPSKGAHSRHGDYSAYVLVGVDTQGTLYVEADLARRATPRMVADGMALCRRFRPQRLGVEANQWQSLLADEFVAALSREHLPELTFSAIHNYASKQLRIRRIAPYLAQRQLRFHRSSPGTRLLVDQLREFPQARHDDGPDALEMALRLVDDVAGSECAV